MTKIAYCRRWNGVLSGVSKEYLVLSAFAALAAEFSKLGVRCLPYQPIIDIDQVDFALRIQRIHSPEWITWIECDVQSSQDGRVRLSRKLDSIIECWNCQAPRICIYINSQTHQATLLSAYDVWHLSNHHRKASFIAPSSHSSCRSLQDALRVMICALIAQKNSAAIVGAIHQRSFTKK